MTAEFGGLGMSLGSLSRRSDAKTRSISAENPTGEKGKGGMAVDGPAMSCARDLGPGWKVSPFVNLPPGETVTLAEINGQGAIQSIWMAGSSVLKYSRWCILRFYWEDQLQPAVECPIGDFFASGWGVFAQVSSLAVAVNPNRGLNCFWEMPFRQKCRITLQNLSEELVNLYYQINYTLTEVPEDALYFHAQFRRTNPLPYKSIYTIIDGIRGAGQYVGTFMAVGVTNSGWWGEGEIKFYLDGDEYPTICGTGTEDYFGGAYNWDIGGQYTPYTTPYQGMHQVLRPDGTYQSQQRFAMYRWHIMDPVRFEQDLRVTIQALGWRQGGRYLPLQCDIASVAYWYQALPTASFPQLQGKDELEII
jgi:hypothetical protein